MFTVAPELAEALDAPVLLHPADDMLWRVSHPDKDFHLVDDDQTLRVGGLELKALHTPGHLPPHRPSPNAPTLRNAGSTHLSVSLDVVADVWRHMLEPLSDCGRDDTSEGEPCAGGQQCRPGNEAVAVNKVVDGRSRRS